MVGDRVQAGLPGRRRAAARVGVNRERVPARDLLCQARHWHTTLCTHNLQELGARKSHIIREPFKLYVFPETGLPAQWQR